MGGNIGMGAQTELLAGLATAGARFEMTHSTAATGGTMKAPAVGVATTQMRASLTIHYVYQRIDHLVTASQLPVVRRAGGARRSEQT